MAGNDIKLIIAEVKFHNDHRTQSDLKVALYVKARFDDLERYRFLPRGRQKKENLMKLV